jgi:hypothetical protein
MGGLERERRSSERRLRWPRSRPRFGAVEARAICRLQPPHRRPPRRARRFGCASAGVAGEGARRGARDEGMRPCRIANGVDSPFAPPAALRTRGQREPRMTEGARDRLDDHRGRVRRAGRSRRPATSGCATIPTLDDGNETLLRREGRLASPARRYGGRAVARRCRGTTAAAAERDTFRVSSFAREAWRIPSANATELKVLRSWP